MDEGMNDRRRRSVAGRLQGAIRRVGMGAQNALEIIRLGHLSEPYAAPFTLTHEEPVYKLRRYGAVPDHGGRVGLAAGGEGAAGGHGTEAVDASPSSERESPVVLLIPPLMVASEIYDISPELSTVAILCQAGIDTWLVDFGAPELMEGGMDRTLDDHVRAVSEAVDRVRDSTGRDVHLAGYSQGGMFCYQAAAFRRSEGLKSVITFGSPVDIHRILPGVRDTAAARLIAGARRVIERPLTQLEGLPGLLTSTGFKLFSARKEAMQLADFVAKLHDRQALERRERSRRFLAGEGFVAWPGPALRQFVDEFIVNNRMTSGGFVIDGRTVTLADIRCPVLYFVGTRDDIARPAAVRAVRQAVPNAEIFEVGVKAGHFGLVVGSRSREVTWPTVIDWTYWQDGLGPMPSQLREPPAIRDPLLDEPEEAAFGDIQFDLELFSDVVADGLDAALKRADHFARNVSQAIDGLRWQLPRLSRLRAIEADTRIGLGLALAEQAASIPDETFFLWMGRAFSYADANRRVDNVTRGLLHCGIVPGQRVGVLMGRRPSYLSVVAALSRVGAVSVLFGSDRVPLDRGIELGSVEVIVADPEHAAAARGAFDGKVLVLGGGNEARKLLEGVIDMEAIDPDTVPIPVAHDPNPGLAGQLAMVIFTGDKNEGLHAARITNRRWAVSALGAAAACTLSPRDTVYCCLPLYHAGGMLVSVGGALMGGARLALASEFSPEVFWAEVRRYGVSVVFYANEMCRELVNAKALAAENLNPVRLFAGSGMRQDVWRRMIERFGSVGILEFYATTEGSAVLANASGEKVGGLGLPLPGSNDISVVRYDMNEKKIVRGDDGYGQRCAPNEVGMLVAEVAPSQPMAGFDGFSDDEEASRRLRRNLFSPNDTWFLTGDLVRVDQDGDFWLVDRVRDMIATESGWVSPRAVEEAIYEVPGVGLCAVYGLGVDGGDGVVVCSIVPQEGKELSLETLADRVARLSPEQRPRYVRLVPSIAMTDGYRPLKAPLRRAGLKKTKRVEIYRYDGGVYRRGADAREARA